MCIIRTIFFREEEYDPRGKFLSAQRWRAPEMVNILPNNFFIYNFVKRWLFKAKMLSMYYGFYNICLNNMGKSQKNLTTRKSQKQ